jgi:hypothetical protein
MLGCEQAAAFFQFGGQLLLSVFTRFSFGIYALAQCRNFGSGLVASSGEFGA